MKQKTYYPDYLSFLIGVISAVFGIVIGIIWDDATKGAVGFLVMMATAMWIIIIKDEVGK